MNDLRDAADYYEFGKSDGKRNFNLLNQSNKVRREPSIACAWRYGFLQKRPLLKGEAAEKQKLDFSPNRHLCPYPTGVSAKS
ncbi:hypothetical protein [Casimicrobium huifangae]|jgi:hypothetical protein|uniref:hypothetical protein n=1 Tax=Casimicrobium huifangae TaxID=2591109 RepID=UPI0012EBD616|nr:hypothetical protein [Casimicrobium huifangae]